MTSSSVDKLIPFNKVTRLSWLPERRGGSKLNASTVHRWYRDGISNQKLEAIPVGGVLCTSTEWLLDFFRRVGEAKAAEHSARAGTIPVPIHRIRKSAAHRAAQRDLAAAGL